METVLYVNNFRGFDDTSIEFEDVNFLVGENSTGKTSILSLLSVLGAPEFWLGQEFNTDDVKLGNFRDLVSMSSKDKKQFSVGTILGPKEKRRKSEDVRAWLMTFSEVDGLPALSEYVEIGPTEQVILAFSSKTIRYKLTKTRLGGNEVPKILGVFRQRAKSLDKDYSDFGVLQRPPGLPRRRDSMQKQIFIDKIRNRHTPATGALEIPAPDFALNLVWIGPVRSRPKRTYDSYELTFSPEGDQVPYIIRRLLSRKAMRRPFQAFLREYGKKSGLFDTLAVQDYGRELAPPFELDAIIEGKALKVSNIGYGVSQVMPVVVELFARSANRWYAIQQPEIHLHPRAQAALGDVLFKISKEEDKTLLIETHSDYLIDRFRLNYRNRRSVPHPTSQVLFFERTKKGNKVTPVKILEDGRYAAEQPPTFRRFFIREQMSLLGIE